MGQPAILVEAIGKPMKLAGFKKKADTWYLDSEETISVLNLQKSSYGPQYYINIGLWLKALGESEYPQEHKCQVRCRWDTLIPQDEKQLERLLDLDIKSMSDRDRVNDIGFLLQKHILTFFFQTRTLEDLKNFLSSEKRPKQLCVYAVAEDLLLHRDV